MNRYQFYVAYYSSTPFDGFQVPIGVFLLEEQGRILQYRLTSDWRRVRCLDPHADLHYLEALPGQFERLFQEHDHSPGALHRELERMSQQQLGVLRISLPRGVEGGQPQEAFERLYAEHVAGRVQVPGANTTQSLARAGSRRWILHQVQESLERHGLANRVERNVAVDRYTAPGDRFRIDYQWKGSAGPNPALQEELRFVHALSLDRDLNQAKMLGYTLWRIRDTAPARLTAIVPDSETNSTAAEGCRRILESARVEISLVSKIDALWPTLG